MASEASRLKLCGRLPGEARCVESFLKMTMSRIPQFALLAVLVFSSFIAPSSEAQRSYDLVILNGRVIDPESKSDSIRNLGITDGTIKTITTNKLTGRTVID